MGGRGIREGHPVWTRSHIDLWMARAKVTVMTSGSWKIRCKKLASMEKVSSEPLR